MLLCEHWLKPDEPVSVDGYNLITGNRRLEFSNGGTACFVNQDEQEKLFFCSVDKYNYLLSERVFEFCIIYCDSLKLYVICLYRSPSGDSNIFLNSLKLLLSGMPVNAKLVLCGDFNINFLDNTNI